MFNLKTGKLPKIYTKIRLSNYGLLRSANIILVNLINAVFNRKSSEMKTHTHKWFRALLLKCIGRFFEAPQVLCFKLISISVKHLSQ